jgi:hypothetical protein
MFATKFSISGRILETVSRRQLSIISSLAPFLTSLLVTEDSLKSATGQVRHTARWFLAIGLSRVRLHSDNSFCDSNVPLQLYVPFKSRDIF